MKGQNKKNEKKKSSLFSAKSKNLENTFVYFFIEASEKYQGSLYFSVARIEQAFLFNQQFWKKLRASVTTNSKALSDGR